MNKMSLQKSIQNFGIKQALKYMEKDPEENIPKLMDMVDKFAPDGWYEAQRNMIRKVIKERGNWYQLILRIYQLDPEVRKAFFQNFIFNATGSIGCKFDFLRGAEGVHRFNQPDRTNGNQVFQTNASGFKFLCNVDHQPEIVDNELFSGIRVAVCQCLQHRPFLRSRERRRLRECSASVPDKARIAAAAKIAAKIS